MTATPPAPPQDYRLADADSARRAMAEVAEELAAAHAIAQTGGSVDLSGLDDSVAVICEAALNFEPDAGMELLPALLDLARDLEVLSGEIRRQQASARQRQEADEAHRRTRAVSAYGRPPATPPVKD
ncbi:MAG TPA: hypothetical protein VEB64_06080 [Azospirillaceae bacterium]|nr:hypothetical protein [Azospirillaceae bacterium]